MREVVGSAKLVLTSADRDATSLFCSRVRVLVRRRRTDYASNVRFHAKWRHALERAKERERVCDSDSARRVRDWLNVRSLPNNIVVYTDKSAGVLAQSRSILENEKPA